MTPASATIPARPNAPLHPHNPQPWRHSAACRGLNPALFFGSIHQMRRAQAVCAGCPVAEVCLWTAMATEDELYRHGCFGGLLPEQRHQLAALCSPQRAAELLALETAWWAS